MMHTKRGRATSGESITEVLVAILIGALAGVMLAVAVSTATGITRRSVDYEEHAALSVSQAEQLLAQGSTDIAPAPTSITFTAAFTMGDGKVELRSDETSVNAHGWLTTPHTSSSETEGYEDLLVFARQAS